MTAEQGKNEEEKNELNEEDLLKIVGAFEHLASSIQGMMGQLANSVGSLADRLNNLEDQLHEIEKIQKNIISKEDEHEEKK
jgi:hypothetical protein